MSGFARDQMAARVARDIPDGAYVNLGIGLPELVANHMPADREAVFHSENGLLGLGPEPDAAARDPDLINAGKKPVTLVPGGAIFHHTDSFAMIRGGHIDICVLGAYQVAANGDLANWATLDRTMPPCVGGAMDLAVGAAKVFAVMQHTDKAGGPKLLERCTYPLTGRGVVDRIYTNLAVIDVTGAGFAVVEMAPGVTRDQLRDATGAALAFADQSAPAPAMESATR